MKSFSCLGESKFLLADEQCQQNHILEHFSDTSKKKIDEWKPITACLSTPCLIPSKGVRILARSCHFNRSKASVALYNKTSSIRPHDRCDDEHRSVQVCDTQSNFGRECLKLVTPSQFASQKCSRFQVRFPSRTFQSYLIVPILWWVSHLFNEIWILSSLVDSTVFQESVCN